MNIGRYFLFCLSVHAASGISPLVKDLVDSYRDHALSYDYFSGETIAQLNEQRALRLNVINASIRLPIDASAFSAFAQALAATNATFLSQCVHLMDNASSVGMTKLLRLADCEREFLRMIADAKFNVLCGVAEETFAHTKEYPQLQHLLYAACAEYIGRLEPVILDLQLRAGRNSDDRALWKRARASVNAARDTCAPYLTA